MTRTCCIIIALCWTARASAGPAASPPMKEIAVEEHLGERLPLALSFTASTGETVRLTDYFDGDTPVVLVLAYARCSMLCSLVLRGVVDAVRSSKLELGEHYRVLTVSIDPRESPAEAEDKRAGLLSAANQRPDAAGWTFLVGEEPTIRALADRVGFHYTWDERTEQFAHPAVLLAVDGEGDISQYLYGIEYAGDTFDRAMRTAANGEAASSGDGGGFLSCFRFDGALRKYRDQIARFFAIGGVVLIAAVGFGLLVLVRKERRTR